MQIIIVEDENKTRQGLKAIIEKYTEHKVVACENDGQTGLEAVIRLRPDVVFSDICMPVMNGLDMLERIKKAGIETNVILLTGYSEFEYARRSIRLGVEDYLLKPLNVEDIIEVLDKVEQKIVKNQAEQVSAEQVLFSLLTEKETENEIYIRQLEQKLHVHLGESISLFLLKNSSVVTETSNEILSLLAEILPSFCLTDYHIFQLPDRHYVLVMIIGGQNVYYMKELFLMHISPAVNDIGECMISYCEINNLSELRKSIDAMYESFQYGFALEAPQIIDQEFIKKVHFTKLDYPDILEQTMRKEIRCGNEKRVRNIMLKFCECVICSDAEPRFRKEYTVRFLLAAIQGMRGHKKDELLDGLSYTLLERIMSCVTRESLQYEYGKIIDSLLHKQDETKDADNGMVLNVIKFIRLNYARDISLTEAAEIAGITPEYLSKLFVKEMGINFSTFLRDFRIRVAKGLLLEGNYKIHEVAEAVGYRDTKYFNKVFKSVVGVAPSDYRRTI